MEQRKGTLDLFCLQSHFPFPLCVPALQLILLMVTHFPPKNQLSSPGHQQTRDDTD